MKSIKDMWEKSYGEGTKCALDYGKLVILGLCIYIAIQVSLCFGKKILVQIGKEFKMMI